MGRKKLTEEEKAAKQLAKELQAIEAEKNQKPVKSMVITVEWRKSRMWGMNPYAFAKVEYQDGTWNTTPTFTASGCGYCKLSTVVADIFNATLKYELWNRQSVVTDKSNLPYGISIQPEYVSFEGGVGISCYPRISEFIGFNMETITWTKTIDVYKLTKKENDSIKEK